MERVHWRFLDLKRILVEGIETVGPLLTAGEAAVVRGIIALPDPVGESWCRLLDRTHPVVALRALSDDDSAARLALEEAGLIDGLVTLPAVVPRLTVAELKGILADRGLPSGGNREELAERVALLSGPSPVPALRVRHRALVRRLERFVLQHPSRDRSHFLLTRLQLLRPVDHPVHPVRERLADRRRLLAWEDLALGRLSPEDSLLALQRGEHRAPGLLDCGDRVAERLLEEAESRRKNGDLSGALALATDLRGLRPDLAGPAGLITARAQEALGTPALALATLRDLRPQADPETSIAVDRVGKRLAKELRVGWAPPAPLRSPGQRELSLPQARARKNGRPTWGPAELLLEDAVCEHVRAAGRRVVHTESGLFTTLAALLYYDALFADVPGALPIADLAGPVDRGAPGFLARREPIVAAIRARMAGGQGPRLVAEAWDRHQGRLIAGVDWRGLDRELLVDLVTAWPADGLGLILEALLEGGLRAGMPDLVIAPGPVVAIPGLFPAKIPSTPQLVELKGPGDSLRDGQRVAHDRLVAQGFAVDLWTVVPAR